MTRNPCDAASLIDALQRLRDRLRGRVCPDYDLCTHAACSASYDAFATLDYLLRQADVRQSAAEHVVTAACLVTEAHRSDGGLLAALRDLENAVTMYNTLSPIKPLVL